jgi:hypothetical protein
MNQETLDHWNALVRSYMPAARIVGLSQEEVEMALRVATRFNRRCPSCALSRAPHHATTQAELEDVLVIYERRCINKPPRPTCKAWTKLEPPIEVIP